MALSTDVDVCNLALDHLGKTNILDLDEGSNEALRCRRQYDVARELALGASPWTFARGWASLAVVTNDREEVFDFKYDIPNNSLKIHKLLEPTQRPDWNAAPQPMYIQNGSIYSHVSDAQLLYIFDSTDVTTWSTEFANYVALELAARLAPGMLRRLGDAREFFAQARDAREKAIERDAQQEDTLYRFGDGYADARGSGIELERRQLDGSTIWDN